MNLQLFVNKMWRFFNLRIHLISLQDKTCNSTLQDNFGIPVRSALDYQNNKGVVTSLSYYMIQKETKAWMTNCNKF